MENKKNPSVDLEKRKGLLFQVGLVFALALVLVSFEWAIFDRTNSDLGSLNLDIEEEEMIPLTQQAPPPPPPPPPPPQTTVIDIVEDDEEIEDELELEDTEMDEDTEIEIQEIEEEEEYVEPEIFTIVEENAEFPGGEAAMNKFLGENLKYPKMAQDAGIQGIVYVTFVVEPSGVITNIKILRGLGGGCDDAAVNAIKKMPKWNAGKQRGKAVRVQFNLPVRFRLS
ncbi:energy transducer TonB [Salibacteraceae bacterium]|jgi:protein TonB|nr:energy transducer TonB [Crocinitomicaceae bacterium]MCH9822127.1 energy transducer TonB [Bacteroidota bacterium]MDB9724800.1 energy transducer TonB [Salibacteraceae bacterium]|tara:strand:+ start:39248 stop:39925 length:678 start_codon:yes stop_codon:yes gene_type:complete